MKRRWRRFVVSCVIMLTVLNSVIFPGAARGVELIPLQAKAGRDEPVSEGADFADLKNHWAEKDIRRLAANRTVKGIYSNGKLFIMPERPITRAEFVTVLARVLGLSPKTESFPAGKQPTPRQPSPANGAGFTDTVGHWAQGSILAAQQTGLTRGYQDGKFSPDRPINRAELVTIISRAKEWKDSEASLPAESLYSDVPKSHWAYLSVLSARRHGAVSGYPDGTFRPERRASRAEAFVLINKAFGGTEEKYNGPTLSKEVLDMFKVTKPDADDDRDGLFNQLEILVGLDPRKPDSGRDGTPDGRKDLDGDGVNNLQEQTYGTDPGRDDTDSDNLTDGEEINTYKTNPLHPDTDRDGLSDGTEVKYGLSPLKQDTDGDGTPDGQEKLHQQVSWRTGHSNQVAVALDTQGDLAQAATISDPSADPGLTNIPGLVGNPVDIEVKAQFDTATLEFSFDPAAQGGAPGENLLILWVDEANQSLVPLEQQWVDPKKNKVYGTTTHFSKYLVVDKEKWRKVWAAPLQKVRGTAAEGNVSVAMVIDSSLTMARNDPDGERKKAVKNFVRGLLPGDRTALIEFDHSARVLQPLTTVLSDVEKAVDRVDEAGGTIIDGAIKKGVEELAGAPAQTKKYLILVTDGKDEAGGFDEAILKEAIKQQVTVFTVGLGDDTDRELLQKIAQDTGGKYYPLKAAAEIHSAFERIAGQTAKPVDSDEDGLADQVETAGLRIYTGELVKTDPKTKDTDGDGVPDGFEAGKVVVDFLGREYYRLQSHPALPDSDGDGIVDAEDPQPMNRKFPLQALPVLFLHGAMAAVSPDFKHVEKYNQVLTSITPLKGGYDGFFAALEEAGYKDYLYFASYDWRHLTKHSVENYLIPAINRMDQDVRAKIKARVAEEIAKYKQANPYFRELSSKSVLKFNLVSHSMGGIVSRLLLEGDYQPYNTRVNKLIMVGTPNHGSVNAYTIWQGGVGQDLTYKILLRLFISDFYEHFYGGKPSLDYDSAKMLGIIRSYFPSVKVLLPTWKFLLRLQTQPGKTVYEALSPEDDNKTLAWLNRPENLDKLYRRTKVYSIAGTGLEVYKGIWLASKTGPVKSGQPWKDGKPLLDIFGNFRFENDPVNGDGTVRVEAVKLKAAPELYKGEHSLLLSEKGVVNQVLSELGINYHWGGELSLIDNQAVMLNDIAGM